MTARHGGDTAIAEIRRHGVETMFTLSGGHVLPLYDGAVGEEPAGGRAGRTVPGTAADPRVLDVRHEQTAVFSAEATARLTRRPGLADLPDSPGVINVGNFITTVLHNRSPTT